MSSSFNRWRPHPWHGIDVGPNPPSVVHAYIESTPFNHIKYEVDKQTGYLRVDRPHRTSSLPSCCCVPYPLTQNSSLKLLPI